MERLVVTPDEARILLREKSETIYKMLKDGTIPAYKSGKTWKIPLKTLEQYIENKAICEARARREMSKNEEV